MAKDYMGYEGMIDRAMRGVVREALRSVLKRGLVGGHHFYISFKTHFPGVEMPDFLREQYPDVITIVMQNQFSGLRVEEDTFDITLNFQKIPAALHVPFAALTGFVDPGVQFGLQFKDGMSGIDGAAAATRSSVPTLPTAKPTPGPKAVPKAKDEPDAKPAGDSQIVSLDKFRKK